MTALTNAPPLPDEPLYLRRQRELSNRKTTALNEMLAYIDTLRAQLEQSPMRDSAIIDGLERRLAEARGEIERLKDAHKRFALLLIENDKRGIEKWASGIHLNIEQGNATVDVVLLADAVQRAERETARADACEKALKIAELKNRGTLANNLCPDHRDKQVGKPCLACEIERLTKSSDASETALRFAAGLASTLPQFSDKHPQEVLNHIKAAALGAPT